MKRYSCDLYRTNNAILIHQRPGRFAAARPQLVSFIIYAALFAFTANLLRPDYFTYCFCFLLALAACHHLVLIPYTYFRTITLRIDPATVRLDRWSCGFRRSRVFRRTNSTRLSSEGFNKLFLGDGKQSFSLTVSCESELLWLNREIQAYLQAVPAMLAVCDPPKPSFSDADCGEQLLITRQFQGEPLQRIPPPSERAAEESVTENTGRIEVRCGNCNKVVPPENVDGDSAIAVCRHCGAIRQLADLMRFPLPADSRYFYQLQGDTLLVRKESTRDYLPMMLLGVAFLPLGFLVFFLSGFTIMPSIGIIGICIVVFAVWLAFDRRIVRITPDKCTLVRIPFFVLFVQEVPRKDVYKAARISSWIPGRDLIRLYYRGGSITLETVAQGYDSVLLGQINHYLYTVPPTDMTPRGVRVYLGGSESKTQEVRPYCPDCGHVIDSQGFDLAMLRGTCDKCNREFPFAESQIMVYRDAVPPKFDRLSYEKGEGRLRIDLHQDWRFSSWGHWFGLIIVFFIFIFWPLFSKYELFEGKNLIFGIFYALIILVISMPRLLPLLTQWTIYFDMKKLEISYRCLFISEKRMIPRGKIATFSSCEKKAEETKILFCPQSMVIAERNDGRPPLRLPGTQRDHNLQQSVWLMNELNDFLASMGKNKTPEPPSAGFSS